MSATINKAICLLFVDRAKAQGMKGKARDKAGLEFILGAVTALRETGHDTDAAHLERVAAFLIATRGYSEIERLATATVEPAPLVEAIPGKPDHFRVNIPDGPARDTVAQGLRASAPGFDPTCVLCESGEEPGHDH